MLGLRMILYNPRYSLALTILILQLWGFGCNDSDYVIDVPSYVTAQEGLCVHIPCSFTVPTHSPVSQTAEGHWYRPRAVQNLMTSSKDDPRKRMFFTGKIPERDCSLFINDVQKSDQNSYQFRLIDPKTLYNYKTLPFLIVTELTDRPEIFQGKLIAGKQSTITCRSPGICAGTPPDITWNGKYGETKNFLHPYPNYTSVYYSNFTFTPSRDDDQSSLTCEVAFLQYTSVTKHMVSLNVESTAGENTFTIKEGDNQVMTCAVDSNPLAEITWFMEDEVIKGPTIGRSLIYGLSGARLRDAGIYRCMGQNEHGTSNKTIEIIIHYAPRSPDITCATSKDCTIHTEYEVYVTENSTFSLLCTARSLPEASLSWVKSDTTQSVANGLLTLRNISLRDEGEFTCVANNKYGESKSSVNIRVTYKPRTVTGKDSGCRDHGGLTACTCIIQSFPTADIEWNIDEKLFPSNHKDDHLNIFTTTINSQTNSTLTFKSMNYRVIHCMSSNKQGRLDLVVMDYNQSGLSVAIIAASCCVVVALLLIGGFLVSFYLRRKRVSKTAEGKKEINSEDFSVIYTNSERPLYENANTENGPQPLPESDASVYMNVEDLHYASINFVKNKPEKVPENTEIEYAEIRK
ncbi:sialic acid-binding Ig-like lectin 16 isoform X2 [Engystomops pustulosus]|uniref:sialic acid-binding Ig-like lectin 16 isoform X2 n=1 Tax=Engystomops pustulosus TaxID=76066 RepID=UPI003AFB61F0